MKNKIKIATPLFIVSISFVLFSFTKNVNADYISYNDQISLDIPENIQSIISNKCMACHSEESKPGKSKSKMNFDKLTNGDYSTGKVISKLDKITKILSKDKMPPQKFLDKYPDKKLTKDESKLIIDWTSTQSSMMKGE